MYRNPNKKPGEGVLGKSVMLVSMEMENKTNKPLSNGGKCIFLIKQRSDNREILIMYYIWKMTQHKSFFSQRIITVNISNYIKV